MKRGKKSKKALIKEKLWTHCKRIVRARDENTCQYCGKVVSGSNAHTSHVIPRSFSMRMHYDTVNLKLLCGYHHLYWWHKNPIEAVEWFKNKFPKRYDYLIKRKQEVASMGSVKEWELQEWLDEFEEVCE